MRTTMASGLALALSGATLCAACSDSSGPGSVPCNGPIELGTLPIAASAINWVTPIGNMGPPTHTIPTDHVGIYLVGTGIPIVSPGSLTVDRVVTTTYLVSPFRQGLTDYALETSLCGGVTLTLGHIETATAKIAAAIGTDCQSYSTADESVKQCRNNRPNLRLAEGEPLGTVGAPSIPAFDLGMYDAHQANYYVDAARYTSKTRTAVCPYEYFSSGLKAQLYAKLGDGAVSASGELPRCGSMSVDVAGTVAGAWVLKNNPVNQQGDETNFAILAPHPLFPQSGQTFAIGLASLSSTIGIGLTQYPAELSGRVNRRFRDVTADGQVYCYVHDMVTANFSFLVQLGAGDVLSIRKVTHVAGSSPCEFDPSTWLLGAGTVQFIR